MVADRSSSQRVIVIGSGPGGATAALFLANAGIETLVMEVGSASAPLGFTARVRGLTVAKKKPPLVQRRDLMQVGDPRAELYEELAPGGLSNQWSCAVPRFSEEDFEDAARAGEVFTWPLGYQDLAPWYDQVEPLLQIAGDDKSTRALPAGAARDRWRLAREWDSVAHAADTYGRTVVAMPYANGATHLLTRSGTAFNTYSQLLVPALREGKLEVLYDAQALTLEWSPREQRVVAVIYRDLKSGRDERLPCRAVVVAAGAVNSAQILLQSSSPDFPNGLGNHHDVLGRYLHDHPLAKLVIDLPKSAPIYPASYITRAALDRSPPLYAAACMQWSGAPALIRAALRGTPGRAHQIGFSVFGTMIPRPDDYVAIDRPQAGFQGRARLRMSLSYPAEALQTLERTREELLDILTRAGWQPRVSVWNVEAPGNSVHYGGTCRMHASPQFGVVDGFGRVHGVRNVAVADSAVFTTGPEKNPVLTAMALAARSSDRLAQELRSGDL